jgi:hypothetical protein
LQHGQAILQEGRYEAHEYDGGPTSFHQQAQGKRSACLQAIGETIKIVWDDEA